MTSLFPILAAISAFSNRVAEAVKSAMKAHFPQAAPETISEVALFVSLAAGIVGALVLNVNVLALFSDNPYLARVPGIVGVILTGCIASVGSEGLQYLMDLLQAKRDRIATPIATTSTSVHVDAETTTTPTTPLSTPEL